VGPGGDTLGTLLPSVSADSALQSKAPTGIEPVQDLLRALEPKIRLYAEHFREAHRGNGAS